MMQSSSSDPKSKIQNPKSVITLTTDFGTRDPYVAAMKGVIRSICPQADVVDLTHEIAPQDILAAALFLAAALPYWPAGSIHVAVVDPGVGTARRALALSINSGIVICPDNGVASLYLRAARLDEARAVENPLVMSANVSPTFHGRDLFAPAAAHLAGGMPLHEIGPRVEKLVEVTMPEVETNGERLLGEIIHIDRFGNLVTNIRPDMLPERVGVIHAGGERIAGLCRTYAEALPGTPTAIIGSSGYMEIAVNGASAQEALQLTRGDSVIINFTK